MKYLLIGAVAIIMGAGLLVALNTSRAGMLIAPTIDPSLFLTGGGVQLTGGGVSLTK